MTHQHLHVPDGYLFAAFVNSPVAVAVTRDGAFIDVNDAFTQLLGWTREEVFGRTMEDIGAVSRDQIPPAGAQLEPTGSVPNQSLTLVAKDGSPREVILSVSKLELDGRSHAISTFVDATEQRRVERELRTSEERFRLIAETISEVFWMADVDLQTTVYVSPAYERVWGRTRRSLYERPRSFLDAIHPEDVGRVLQTLEAKQAGQPFDHEFRIVRPDGETRWIWDRGFPVVLDGGTIRHFVGVAQDVTHRREREEQLRESLERFQLVARATHDAVWDFNVKTGVAWWSDIYYDKYGYSRSAPPSLEAWSEHVHPADRERVTLSFADALNGGDRKWSEEYRYRLADGSYADVVDRAHVVRDNDGVAQRFTGVIEDVTERLNLHAQLQQAAKMEAIGRLAGGVAHDFNNLLTVIHGHATFISESQALNAETRESAVQIVEMAERAANLTRQLLLFSRQQVLQRTHFDVNEALAAMRNMLSRILGEDIRLEFELPPLALFIDADAGMVDQIVLNLVVNARDAMPNGGRLLVSAREVTAAEVPARAALAGGPYVCMTVRDTGDGIAPDVLPHIFEPFFSTKGADRGTGLGLFTIFGIVKQHQGWIDVDTRLGEGTSVHVWLPLSRLQQPSVAHEKSSITDHGGETVLLVEDEPALLKLMRTVLERTGYRILHATNASEALDLWPANEARVNLLVTDMVLPSGPSGRELAARLRERRPDLKVLLVSGYTADFSGKEFKQQPGHYFLQKPFSPKVFVETVRECLNSPGYGEQA